jgi:two-component system, OmpR family, heavy metal sensor histidine kinase CusS
VHRLTLVLNEMIARLENSFRQAKHFSADTSHELRTPLAVIHAGLESMLSSEEITPSQERQLLDLLDATTQLSSLSEKLLLLSRADAGHLDFECCPCDLVGLLREAIDEAAIFAEAAAIVIHLELPESLEVIGDPARLMQVLRNLLENAVKYNHPGGQVNVKLATEGASARLEITNTGQGLAPEQAARVFDRFFRAETHRGSPGHGLGLSISQEIVRAHGGDLRLERFETDGITFVARLRKAA